MNESYFLLRCPRCKQTMKYSTRKSTLIKKRKVCVYCGFSMGVNKAVIKKL